MKIALVHDHLISYGGAEQVLKAFAEIWPDAPIYTLLYDPDRTNQFFMHRKIIHHKMQHIPLSIKKYQWTLPLRPRAIESYSFDEYDIVFSNSASLAKGVITGKKTLHINHCLTPTRFLWVDTSERYDPLERSWPISWLSDHYKNKLRAWDYHASQRVNTYIANSNNAKERIKRFYHRDAVVVHSPVDIESFHISPHQDNYFLIGGRLVAYKKFDIAIQAFNKLNIPLKVFGDGPFLKQLRGMANPNIEFLGLVSDNEKAQLYARAQAFIHPQIEDFGITAIESMASGRPVIAYRAGGATETVHEGTTGLFFDHQDWAALAHSVIKFSQHKFDSTTIKCHAEQFSVDNFKQKIKSFVEEEWSKFKRPLSNEIATRS